MEEIQLSWGLKLYSDHIRGMYVSFTKPLEDLAVINELSKKSTKRNELKEQKRLAKESAIKKLQRWEYYILQHIHNTCRFIFCRCCYISWRTSWEAFSTIIHKRLLWKTKLSLYLYLRNRWTTCTYTTEPYWTVRYHNTYYYRYRCCTKRW